MNGPPWDERRIAAGRVELRAQPAGSAYYLPLDGESWRIYDCQLVEGLLDRVYLEADIATHRVFAEHGGRRLLYRRESNESFKLSPRACERQMAAARPLRDEPYFDSSDAGA